MFKTKSIQKDFLKNMQNIPLGILESIHHMRLGEYSRVKLHPKYGFTYNNNDNLNNINNLLLNKILDDKNIEFNSMYLNEHNKISQTIIDKLKSNNVLFFVRLNNFIKYYDLNNDSSIIKFNIEKSDSIIYPNDYDVIDFDVQIRYNNNILLSCKTYTNIRLNNLIEEEKTIFKSMKLYEKSNVELSPSLSYSLINNKTSKNLSILNSCIIDDLNYSYKNNDKTNSFILYSNKDTYFENVKKHKEDNLKFSNLLNNVFDINFFKEGRFFYIIKLIKVIETNDKELYINGNLIYKTLLFNGVGNVSPWANNISLLLIKLTYIDNNNKEAILYDNYSTYNFSNNVLEEIKSKIKLNKNYDLNIQELAGKYINEYLDINFNTNAVKEGEYNLSDLSISNNNQNKLLFIDSYSMFLPNFIQEFLKTTKILETNKLTFNGSIEYLKLNNNVEIINNNIKTSNHIHINNNKELTYSFTLTLLNFQENPFVFQEVDIEENRINKLSEYKTISNYFYSNKLYNMSIKLNCYIIDDLIRNINLKKQRVIIKFEFNDNKELQDVLSKIHSNLISGLFKVKRFIDCKKYISSFYDIFSKNFVVCNGIYFKVSMLYYILLVELLDYEAAKDIIVQCIEVEHKYKHNNTNSNILLLNNKLKEINKMLVNNQNNKSKLIKKMFKFDY